MWRVLYEVNIGNNEKMREYHQPKLHLDGHSIPTELLEAMFSAQSDLGCYKQEEFGQKELIQRIS
jgi:hypothetical protein